MLRKYTSFFDSSLENINEAADDEAGVLLAYENACNLCDHFVDLIRDISFIPYLLRQTHSEENGYMKEIGARLDLCFKGMGVSSFKESDLTIEFEKAAKKVYRLETILRYPWESGWDGHTKRRDLHLDINFFEKGAKQPYYRIQFWFSNSEGNACDVYWGEWPKKKEERSEETE